MQTNFWRDCTTSLFPPFFTFIFFLSFPFLSSSLYSFWILCLPNLTYSPLLAVSSLSLSLTRMLPRACHVRECACVRLAVSLSPASEGDGTGGDCTFLLMLPGAPSWFRLPTNPFPIHTCVTVICWCCVVLVTGKRSNVSVRWVGFSPSHPFLFLCLRTNTRETSTLQGGSTLSLSVCLVFTGSGEKGDEKIDKSERPECGLREIFRLGCLMLSFLCSLTDY